MAVRATRRCRAAPGPGRILALRWAAFHACAGAFLLTTRWNAVPERRSRCWPQSLPRAVVPEKAPSAAMVAVRLRRGPPGPRPAAKPSVMRALGVPCRTSPRQRKRAAVGVTPLWTQDSCASLESLCQHQSGRWCGAHHVHVPVPSVPDDQPRTGG